MVQSYRVRVDAVASYTFLCAFPGSSPTRYDDLEARRSRLYVHRIAAQFPRVIDQQSLLINTIRQKNQTQKLRNAVAMISITWRVASVRLSTRGLVMKFPAAIWRWVSRPIEPAMFRQLCLSVSMCLAGDRRDTKCRNIAPINQPSSINTELHN